MLRVLWSTGERQIRCRVIIDVKTGQEHMYHKSPGRRQLFVFIQNGCSFVVPDYPWSLAYWFNRVTARMRFDKSPPRCNHFTGCMGISKSCCPGLGDFCSLGGSPHVKGRGFHHAVSCLMPIVNQLVTKWAIIGCM